MYLHLGQSVVIPDRDILGIFDLDNASWAFKTRELLERAEEEGRTIWLTEDLPRSFILADSRWGRWFTSPRCPPLPWPTGRNGADWSRNASRSVRRH